VFFSSMTLIAILGFAGCSGSAPEGPAANSAAENKDGGHSDEAHPEEGPHQGHLIELGQEEFHAELTHDDPSSTVTVYLLDKLAKSSVYSTDTEVVLNLVVEGKPLQAKLAAVPQEGDPAGQSSRFLIADETVLEALEAPTTTGRLNVTIEGKTYIGTVEHHEHEEKE